MTLFGALVLAGCGEISEVTEVGSPIEVTNGSLSERLANQELEGTEVVFDDDAPQGIAFAEALESGQPIALNIDTGPSGTGVFAGPGRQYSEVTRVASGADVLATGTQSGEWAVVDIDGVEGWVNIRRLTELDLPEQTLADSVTIQDTVAVYTVPSSATGTNLRATPQGSGALLIRAGSGAEMVATGRTDRHWVELTYENVTGWASGNFIVESGTRTISRTVLLSELNATTTTPPATAAPVNRSSSSRTVTTRAPVVRRAPVTAAPRAAAPRAAAPTTAAPAPARPAEVEVEVDNNNNDAEATEGNGGGGNGGGGGGGNDAQEATGGGGKGGGGGNDNAPAATEAPATAPDPDPEPAPAPAPTPEPEAPAPAAEESAEG